MTPAGKDGKIAVIGKVPGGLFYCCIDGERYGDFTEDRAEVQAEVDRVNAAFDAKVRPLVEALARIKLNALGTKRDCQDIARKALEEFRG